MKYQIEYFPNPDYVAIHVNKSLIKVYNYSFHPGSDCSLTDLKKSRPAEGLQSLLETIYELEGMNGRDIYVERYRLSFGKSPLFSWQDILPAVLDALRTFIADDGILEEKAPPLNQYASASPSSIEEDDHDLVDLDDIVE